MKTCPLPRRSLLALAGRRGAWRTPYPSRPHRADRAVPGGRTDRHAWAHHGRTHEDVARPDRWSIENVTGAGATIGVGRAVQCRRPTATR